MHAPDARLPITVASNARKRIGSSISKSAKKFKSRNLRKSSVMYVANPHSKLALGARRRIIVLQNARR